MLECKLAEVDGKLAGVMETVDFTTAAMSRLKSQNELQSSINELRSSSGYLWAQKQEQRQMELKAKRANRGKRAAAKLRALSKLSPSSSPFLLALKVGDR